MTTSSERIVNRTLFAQRIEEKIDATAQTIESLTARQWPEILKAEDTSDEMKRATHLGRVDAFDILLNLHTEVLHALHKLLRCAPSMDNEQLLALVRERPNLFFGC